MLYKK